MSPTVIFPVSRSTYSNIEQTFGLDLALKGHVAAEGIMITEFKAFDDGHGIFAISKRRHLAVTYDPASATTYVLARCNASQEAEEFLSLLQGFQAEVPTTTAVVVAWSLKIAQLRASIYLEQKRAILMIEEEVGLYSWTENPRKHLDRSDLHRLTQQLMALSNAWDGTAINFQLELINRFSNLDKHSVLESLIAEPRPSPNLRLHMSQLRDLLVGLRTMNREIQQRAEVVLQTVSPCLK